MDSLLSFLSKTGWLEKDAELMGDNLKDCVNDIWRKSKFIEKPDLHWNTKYSKKI